MSSSFPFKSTDKSIELLQAIVHDYFQCMAKFDVSEGDGAVLFVGSNRALPASIAASLHAMLKAVSNGGKLPAQDVLLCFTCIMAALTGGGALDKFLRTRQADVPTLKLLSKAVSEEFNHVFAKKKNLLYGAFKNLHESKVVLGLQATAVPGGMLDIQQSRNWQVS